MIDRNRGPSVPLMIRRANPLLRRFISINLILILALGWLGWRLLDQDRELARQRSREQLETSADAIASGLLRGVTSLRDTLAGVLADAGDAKEAAMRTASALPSDAVLLLTADDEFESFPRDRLLYEPPRPVRGSVPAAVFARGDSLEFHGRDPASAATQHGKLANSPDPSIRAAALARVGRASRKARSIPAALAAYDALGTIDDGFVDGVPASLVAGAARLALWRETGDTVRARREAVALRSALHAGRWRIARETFEFYDGELARETGGMPLLRSEDQVAARIALSDAAASVWSSWRNRDDEAWAASGIRTAEQHGHHLLIIWASRGNRLAALIAGPAFVSAHILPRAAAQVDRDRVTFELTDQNGAATPAAARGTSSATSTDAVHVSRSASETGLPWGLRVTGAAFDPGDQISGARQPLLIAGLSITAFLALFGTWAVSRAANREFEVARLQSEFVSAVSHEFRSPLTSLRQLTELLASGRVSSSERRQEYYDMLRRETFRLNRFVESLLDFSRRDAGFDEPAFSALDIVLLVRETIDEYSREPTAAGYAFEFTPPSGPVAVRGDSEALKRAFWNLLDNAVKYSPAERRITIELSCDGGAVSMRVIDRGIGIPGHEQAGVFEKFRRGAAARDRGIRGTGIGLAMVRQIVESHGGTISVDSAPGRGSVFSISLPVVESQARPDAGIHA